MRKTLWVTSIAAMACMQLFANEPPPRPLGIAPPTRIPDAPPPDGPAGLQVATSEVPRAVRRAVVADAARRFGVAESAVVLSGAEKVTWSDGALGCPAPGQMYSQAQVPGFRVLAKTAAGSFLYHTDSRGQVLICAPRK